MSPLDFLADLNFHSDWTLAAPVRLSGIGVHTGADATLEIQPSSSAGLCLEREGQHWPLSIDQVRDTRFCTTVGPAHAPVMTLEHVLAALYGLGVSAAVIVVDGPEAPILDGSAQALTERLIQTGLRSLASRRRMLALPSPWQWREGEVEILAEPADRLSIHYTVDFARAETRLIQSHDWQWSPHSFATQIASARTFAFAADVEKMRELGLVKGGSLDNALVLNEAGQPLGEMRFGDEPARHKILDCLGDLALLGGWLQARLVIRRGGHSAHVTMVKSLKERALPVDE